MTTDQGAITDPQESDESTDEQSPPDGSSTDGQPTDEQSPPDGSSTDGQPTDEQSPPDGSSTDGQVSDIQAGDGGTGTATTAADPGPPYLIVDQYPGDSGAHPPWETLVTTAGYCGAILKAWDGKQYNDGGWFATNWSAVKDAGGDRYGASWFRGAYLFLEFAADGAGQADAYLAAIDRAGGWDSGDIVPIIDVELGKATNPKNFNAKASAQQIVDCATGCAERIKSVTGSRVMLYGRGAMRDRGITSHMGCDLVWNPSWTATMVTNGLQTWGLEDIALWQYCGDNTSALPNYPHSVPGFSKIDISVYVRGAQKPTLEMMRTSLLR